MDSGAHTSFLLFGIVSSYYTDRAHFPAGSVNYDCTLVMRDLPHEWQPVPPPVASNRDRFTPVSSPRPSCVRRWA